MFLTFNDARWILFLVGSRESLGGCLLLLCLGIKNAVVGCDWLYGHCPDVHPALFVPGLGFFVEGGLWQVAIMRVACPDFAWGWV